MANLDSGTSFEKTRVENKVDLTDLLLLDIRLAIPRPAEQG